MYPGRGVTDSLLRSNVSREKSVQRHFWRHSQRRRQRARTVSAGPRGLGRQPPSFGSWNRHGWLGPNFHVTHTLPDYLNLHRVVTSTESVCSPGLIGVCSAAAAATWPRAIASGRGGG